MFSVSLRTESFGFSMPAKMSLNMREAAPEAGTNFTRPATLATSE